jgi:uncharacterized membrane protein SirB2
MASLAKLLCAMLAPNPIYPSNLAMSYLAVRHLHITCAMLSIGLFLLRGCMALAGRDWRRWSPLRWLPHANDTVLLIAAATLAGMSGQYPIRMPWLTAKLLALVAYILLGRQALKPNLTRAQRAAWLAAALACVGYIVSVAVTRNPAPWQSL